MTLCNIEKLEGITLPFPKSDRIIYKHNPLDRVICQLRFPPILKIESALPTEFQESIRDTFPLYREKMELGMDLPAEAKGIIQLDTVTNLLRSTAKNHEFISEDSEWKINLTKSFVALSTSNYSQWETFEKCFNRVRVALTEIYRPAYYTRTGLRYIDVIRKSRLGLEKSEWSDLLQPYILGITSDSSIGSRVQNFENEYLISLMDDESNVRVKTSYAKPANSTELCYMIDSDFHNDQKKDEHEVSKLLTSFNQSASRLIQWCITPRLHEAMGPESP